MEVKQKKVIKIPIEDIFEKFGIKADKNKDWIHYSSSKDELEIEIEEWGEEECQRLKSGCYPKLGNY